MLIILVLLAAMASLAVGNSVALGHLRKELRLIEQRQLRHSGAVSATNRPPPPRALVPAKTASLTADQGQTRVP